MTQSASDLFPPPDQKLFQDFSPVYREQWQAEIDRILEKQGKAGRSLNWQVTENISLPPFLLAEDLLELSFTQDRAGAYPFTRSTNVSGQPWSIQMPVQSNSPSNSLADNLAEAKGRGADGATIFVGDSFPIVPYGKGLLVNDILEADLTETNLNLQALGDTKLLLEIAEVQSAKSNLKLLIDIYQEILVNGSFAVEPIEFYSKMAALYQKNKLPLLCVRADLFHSSGALTDLELALTLSAASEMAVGLIDAGLTANQAFDCITLYQPVGPLYFVEIAKLRATRRLSALLAKGFGISKYQNPILNQNVVTSIFNQSYYDQHTNMLRSCTEVMSAVLGGASSVLALPLDAAFQKDDSFSRRMAINTQLIVRNESYLHKVSDPAGGSYYIEDATNKIAEAAWQIFQEIEAEGGYLTGLEKGTIQKRLKQAGQKRLKDLASRKEIQIGVNQFPNNNEPQINLDNNSILSLTDVDSTKSSNDYESVPMFRVSNQFESLRHTTEKCVRKPLIQLLPFGQLSIQRARAAFMVNFFGCAAFSVNDPGSLETIDQCIEFAKKMISKDTASKQKVDAFVLCASDSEYLPAVTKCKDQLQELNVPIIVAGNPDDAEQLKLLGIDNFVHLKTNLLQTLTDYQQRFCK